jgi:2-methylisocitrate lyase-like PEP mutase family enzyme
MPTQHEKAEQFRALHYADAPLVLINAWDVASARAVAQTMPAVATSSWAVALAHGYDDGQQLPLASVLELAGRICRAVTVPVSVDFEAGYGDTPEQAAESARALRDAGAIGINLEDGLAADGRRLIDPELHAAKIAAIRAATSISGAPLFINARTDPFYLHPGPPEEQLAIAISRAQTYAKAGADGIFVPNLLDTSLIARLVKEVSLPVNIMAATGGPDIAALAVIGVKRVSTGGWPFVVASQGFAAVAGAVAKGNSLAPLTPQAAAR